jgi:hypothetical protein
MQIKRVNKDISFKKLLAIIPQEGPYMIHLLGQQKYTDIVKTIVVGWVGGVSLFFFSFLLSMNFLVSII